MGTIVAGCLSLNGFDVRSVDEKGFGIRIIFEDGVVSGGNLRRIFNRAPQFKTNAVFALPANWKPLALQQRSFMHQAVRLVHDSINSAFRYYFSRSIFLSHHLYLGWIQFARFRELG